MVVFVSMPELFIDLKVTLRNIVGMRCYMTTSATPLLPPPVAPPAALMDGLQLRTWLAALRSSDVLPCRQTIRSLCAAGMPHGRVGSSIVYDPLLVWAWIQDQMVRTDVRQQAIDAAGRDRRRSARAA